MTLFASRPRAAAIAPALFLCLLAAAATAQTTVSFTPADGQFQCGQTWTVDVMVDAMATDLRGCSLVVQYDNSAIRPVSVTAGSLVAGAPCTNFIYWFGPSDADSVAVDVANLGCSVSGPGSVVRITFEGYAGGLSAITLRSGILRTGTNAPIPFTTTGAQVRYDCAVGETASPWGSVKALYR